MEKIRFETKTVGEILQDGQLATPSYQRPYKWERQQIRNLFYDLQEARGKDSYQIGSLILHANGERLDIVDGQQRLISTSLFLNALDRLNDYPGGKNLLARQYDQESCRHARDNAQEWGYLIGMAGQEEADEVCDFLLNHCQVAVITMPKDRLSEAFQLFDSQNNRGKALEPHDLLKAYHLRSIPDTEENVVEKWESFVDNPDLDLKTLFDRYLFRMRRWSRGETGLTKRRYGAYLCFTDNFVDDFKGVDLHNGKNYPYLALYRSLTTVPTSLTMPILDGETFFTYIEESHASILGFQKTLQEKIEKYLPEDAQKITQSKKSRYQKVHQLFENLALLFMERFGADELTKEILEIIFIWAYYPRVKARAIYDSTLGNYAAGGRFQNKDNQKLFQILASASTPKDFLTKIDTSYMEHWTVARIVAEEKANGK